MNEKEIAIHQAHGRPMLHWVGKKPLEKAKPYPAQLKARYGFGDEAHAEQQLHYQTLIKDWHHLLLHGDNKEVLSSMLCKGFRGKIDLIYIDPPFDSKADYIRKVELRGIKSTMDGQQNSVIEQKQYEDIWKNDTYLQFMYERLMLLRELLSDKGSIYLHCDWHKSHHLRFLLDEVFGEDNFVNEVIWHYYSGGNGSNGFAKKHDTIFVYCKTGNHIFHPEEEKKYVEGKTEGEEQLKYATREWHEDEQGTYTYINMRDVWYIPIINPLAQERLSYPTQKPEALLERIITASSNEDSIVLDCFAGSGTLAAVAQKLGRKWIAADMNNGAIQTTAKRLYAITTEQNGDIEGQRHTKRFCHYHINNYDFQQRHNAIEIVTERYGIEPIKTDSFFDGTIKESLVKIVDLNRPCTMVDIEAVKTELQNRPNETRHIRLIASGVEVTVEQELEKYNKTHPINKIIVSNIQTDGITISEPAEAEITVTRKDNTATVVIKNYLSPTILKRLDMDRSMFDEQITDFRCMIDVVHIDANYDGAVFNTTTADIPKKKHDFIAARYDIQLPSSTATVAVKIIDMLGEEILHIDKP